MSFTYMNWSSFTAFFSADYSSLFLKKIYTGLKLPNAEQKSYENCYPFMYYLEHGKLYYEQAEVSPLPVKPILLFYGMVHLCKACILTVEPDYPETTAVLAHGLSSRKRKKQHYSFLDDEVKLQKHGLFPLLAESLFHIKQLEGDKIKMGDLLECIPELSALFLQLKGKPTFFPVTEEDGQYLLPGKVLDLFHMTDNRFRMFLQSKSAVPIQFNPETPDNKIAFTASLANHFEPAPFKFNLCTCQLVFPLNKEGLFLFPELLTHYLLLYNLGMIARYEIEWWSELTKMMPNEDYPFIESFLDISLKKGPYLIYQYLASRQNCL